MGYIETKDQIADIFTKALDAAIFIKFRDMLVASQPTVKWVVKESKDTEDIKFEKTCGDEAEEMNLLCYFF